MTSRYDTLGPFLASQRGDRIPLKFNDVERALGFPLSRSKRYPAWWSNNPSNNPMTKVWLDAGFATEQVDTVGEKLVFRRAPPTRSGGHESTPLVPSEANGGPGLIARLQAELGGTVTYAPGFDPTEPTGEVWDAAR